MDNGLDFYGDIQSETESAILFYDGEEENWLPKSQIKIKRDEPGEKVGVNIIIPEWLAYEKGMI